VLACADIGIHISDIERAQLTWVIFPHAEFSLLLVHCSFVPIRSLPGISRNRGNLPCRGVACVSRIFYRYSLTVSKQKMFHDNNLLVCFSSRNSLYEHLGLGRHPLKVLNP